MDQAPLARATLVREMANYLAWRANLQTNEPGASLDALSTMAVHNTGEALGEERAAGLRDWFSRQAPAQGLPRIEIDGALYPWEFLVCADGRLVKTDGVDHCRGHDLIGCQPIEWDIAGARVEYAFSDSEIAFIVDRIQAGAQRRLDVSLIDYLEPCYLAFQLGLWTIAAEAESGQERARLERARLAATVRRYQTALDQFLDRPR
jgi:hypothetical protein